MASDYDRWFVSLEGGEPIKCKRERLTDHLRDTVGPVEASRIFPLYRRATFSENCKLELIQMEDNK